MRTAAAAEAMVAANGARLWTSRQGGGPPLVLLHGGPGLWEYFDDLAPVLDDLAEVHRYDQRGGGRSERVPPYGVATFVADLDALRSHWGHERWIVAGHSWGAALALAYAVEHPQRVAAIVYVSGTGIVDDWHDEYEANAGARRTPEERARRAELRAVVKQGGELSHEEDREYCVLTWLSDYADRSRARELAARLLRSYGPNYELNAALNADWDRLLADSAFVDSVRGIDAPVLVLHGAEDPRPPRLAERLAASLPDPRLEIIDRCGHLPWVEQPDQTRDALRAFLAQVQP